MAGFVNPSDYTEFDNFIDEIGITLPGCQLYRYGQTDPDSPGNVLDLQKRESFGLNLHQPKFYGLSFNPDDRLIDHLAGEDKPVLSVLISDGVYSEPDGKTAPPVIEAIRKWMERGRVFGILVLKSQFNGPFYSEKARRMLPGFNIKSRPFYAFVFSPTRQGFRDLQEKLKRRFKEMRTILFADDSVECELVMPDRVKGRYSLKKPPEVAYYWQMLNSDFFEQKNPLWLDYRVSYIPSPEYPAAEFKPDIEPQYYRWTGNRFEAGDKTPSGFKCEVRPPEGNELLQVAGGAPPSPAPAFIIHTLLTRDLSSDFSFYRLKVNTSFHTLRQDIRELSTHDDSIPGNGEKTFRFFELISALTDVHFKSRLTAKTSPALFITAANH